jgi:hypothetical protein
VKGRALGTGKSSHSLGRMSELRMRFEEGQSDVDPTRPLIYLWEIVGLDGVVCCSYVGKASGGANRPRTQYRRNVHNILNGRPYRKGKPDQFRVIHRRMAQAVRAGETVRLTLVCNVAPGENINQLERFWQVHYGAANEHAP